MKKLLFLFLFPPLLGICQTSSPYSEHYMCEDEENGFYCDLYFVGNEYCLMLTHFNEEADAEMSILLSEGSVDKNGRYYILKDHSQDYTLLLEETDDELVMLHSYKFLIQKRFAKTSNYEEEWFTKEVKTKDQLEEAILANNKEQRKEIPLPYGFYKVQETSEWRFSLQLNENETYDLCYKDRPLSEGSYKRDKNTLILNDDYLRCTFYALIKDGKITGIFLPFHTEAVDFFYSK